MKKEKNNFQNFASKWNAPPHTEISEEERKNRDETTTSGERRNIKKFLGKAHSAVQAIMDSGAGYYADQSIRDYFMEFNNRFWTYGLKYSPASFNVLGKFVEGNPDNYYFNLKDEEDSIFLCGDFFEFITDENFKNDPRISLNSLKDNIIYNYSVIGDPRELTFKTDDSKHEYAVCGISMIRDKNELSWILTGGPIVSDDEKKLGIGFDLKDYETEKAMYTKPDFYDEKKNIPVMIPGLDDVWRNTVFGRTEIDTLTHQVRYKQDDFAHALMTATDDPIAYSSVNENIDEWKPDKETETILKQKTQELDSQPTLFNLAESLFNLPEYFNFKLQYVSTEEVKTRYGQNRSKLSTSKAYKYAPQNLKTFIKKVKSLQIINPNKPPSVKRNYTSPQFQVSVDGFYRKINPETYGKDKRGNEVLGRTWIKSHMRWRDKSPKPKVIYLKSSIKVAKEKLEKLKNKEKSKFSEPYQKKPEKFSKTNLEGYIYLMKNDSMKENIFKIGKTSKTPDERAEDLSKSTGVPEKFEVINYWRSKNTTKDESEIFASLENYRYSDNREFFQIEKNEAIKKIEFIINKNQ